MRAQIKGSSKRAPRAQVRRLPEAASQLPFKYFAGPCILLEKSEKPSLSYYIRFCLEKRRNDEPTHGCRSIELVSRCRNSSDQVMMSSSSARAIADHSPIGTNLQHVDYTYLEFYPRPNSSILQSLPRVLSQTFSHGPIVNYSAKTATCTCLT